MNRVARRLLVKRRIAYVQYTNPTAYPPLEHSAKIFTSLGWEVSFYGVHADGDADRFRFSDDTLVNTNLLRRWPGKWFLKVHLVWFAIWCSYRIILNRPDMLYVSDPRACAVGVLLTWLTGVPVVYHEHDSPREFPLNTAERIMLRARKLMGWRSRLCILPSVSRANAFSRAIPNSAPVIPVMNCPVIGEVIKVVKNAPRSGQLRVYYQGSLVPQRLPLTILDALAELPDEIELMVIGYETRGYPNYGRHFQHEASSRKVASRVRFLGTVETRHELLWWCAQNDVGLALMPMDSCDPNEKAMAGASNKVFDYLACGLAVLVSDIADYRQLFVENGVAISCNPADPSSLAAALRWFLNHPKETNEMGERGRQRIMDEWNYERQFEGALEAIAGFARCSGD